MEAVKTFLMNKENYPMITMVLLGLTIIILLSCVMKSEKFRFGRRDATTTAKNISCAARKLLTGVCPSDCTMQGGDCVSQSQEHFRRATATVDTCKMYDIALFPGVTAEQQCNSAAPIQNCMWNGTSCVTKPSEKFRQLQLPAAVRCPGYNLVNGGASSCQADPDCNWNGSSCSKRQ
jgi:hypothetical protein